MTNNLNTTESRLSLLKIVLFTIACILIFVLIAVICDLLTFWIPSTVPKIVLRELVLRMPLTIYALHVFAGRVIKTYNPGVIYGKLSLVNVLKWTAISIILPAVVWLFYYLFGFAVPFGHSASFSAADGWGILVKWLAISIAAGFTEEVLFRGHLLMIISSRGSTLWTIFVTSLIFGIVHIAMLSSFGAIDILTVVGGGIIAGTMFACIYWYTRSVWYAAIVHTVWDIFFIGKITTIAVSQTDANLAIAAFKLTTKSRLLTGGSFGLETGLPCFIVYVLVVIVIARIHRPTTNKLMSQ